MLTPLDIYGKTFSKSLRGYEAQEVDAFLAKVVKTFEDLYKENIELKEKQEHNQATLERYQQLEKTMQNTLMIAQSTAEEVKENATRDRELLLREAENKIQKMLTDAELDIQAKKREIDVSILVAKSQADEIKDQALKEKEALLKQVQEIKEDTLKEKDLALKKVNEIKEEALKEKEVLLTEAEAVKKEAFREKELILKEAEKKAEQILAEAEAKVYAKKKEIEDFVNKAQEEFEQIKVNGKVARAKLRNLLETELRIMYEEQIADEARQENMINSENNRVKQIQNAKEKLDNADSQKDIKQAN